MDPLFFLRGLAIGFAIAVGVGPITLLTIRRTLEHGRVYGLASGIGVAFADGTYGAGWNGVGAATYLGKAGQGVTGLLYGDTKQFVCQLMGAAICAAWAFGSTFALFKMVNAVKSMRVAPEVEQEGLDVPEFGLPGYPEDAVHSATA